MITNNQTTRQTAPARPAQTQAPLDEFSRLLEKPHGERFVQFTPFASETSIKLSPDIVQKYIATPTRSGKTCGERDAMRFVMMCVARKLNPFEGDAFLTGFDTQDGPQFSLITAHQAFLKRAEVHPEYDGMESGIVILDADGQAIDREGDFIMPGETLVGGWARVHLKTRKVPTYRRLPLVTYNKGVAQWKTNPHGMICKCAEADALRSSFPTQLGGLYLNEEIGLAHQEVPVAKRPNGKAKDLVAVVQNFEPETTDAVPDDVPMDDAPTMTEPPKPEETKPKAIDPLVDPKFQLEQCVIEAGFTFGDFVAICDKEGLIQDPTSLTNFGEVKQADASRLLRMRKTLIEGLKVMRGSE